MDIFEVRVFKAGRWAADMRCDGRDEALAQANRRAGDRGIDGVKVVEETWDEAGGLFRDKTVFSYFKQYDKVFDPRLKKKEGAPPAGPKAPAARAAAKKAAGDLPAWLLVLALLLGAVGNVVLAFYWGGGGIGGLFASMGIGDGDSGYAIYDLPPVTMSYKDETGARAVRMQLGVELSGADDLRNLEQRLTGIVNRLALDLSGLDESGLDSAQDMNRLRRALHEGLQEAAGNTQIEGVLFRDVVVF